MQNLNYADNDVAGIGPIVKAPKLEPSKETRYTVDSEAQAIALCETLRETWEDGISNRATITAYKNHEPPVSDSQMTQAGKSWYPNTSSGFLDEQCEWAKAQFVAPIQDARYLIANELPDDRAEAEKKASIMRQGFTDYLRSWPCWDDFVNLVYREATHFGFGFGVFFDEWQPMPTFVRQDKGFLPAGTEVMDRNPPQFSVDYDYKPDELIEMAKRGAKAGAEWWNLKNVAAAVNAATPEAVNPDKWNLATFEEMTRQQIRNQPWEKGYRVIKTWHLWTVDPDSTVSHYIILADPAIGKKEGDPLDDSRNEDEPQSLSTGRILFEKHGQFKSMEEVLWTGVFAVDEGTIHGCWGVGQRIFDIALEYEQQWNGWMAATKLLGKVPVTPKEGNNPNEVALQITEAAMILENGTYSGNIAVLGSNPEGFEAALLALEQKARNLIGRFVPPIPSVPTDVKSSHIKQQAGEQDLRREQNLKAILLRFARLATMIAKRIGKNGQPDENAKKLVQSWLDAGLTEEDIDIWCNQPPNKTIYDYTPYAIAQRALFAQKKIEEKNPRYDQQELERIVAEAALGLAGSRAALVKGGDVMVEKAGKRDQILEVTSMLQGQDIEVVPSDPHWFHMQALRPVVTQAIMSGDFVTGTRLLTHYGQHYVLAMAQKLIPGDGNNEKSFVARATEAIQTQTIPEDGLEDRVDPIEALQQQMAAGTPTGPVQPIMDIQPKLEPEIMS